MRGLAWAYLAAAFGFIYLPVAALVLFSFRSEPLPVPPFDGPSLAWYREVIGDGDLMATLGNSLMVAAASSAVTVALGFDAASGFGRHDLPGEGWLRGLLIAPLTVSSLIVGLGLLIVLQRVGAGLSLWTAGIGHVVINLPLGFAIVFAAMGAQQSRAEDAARDLGADEARVVLLVTVPMLTSAILAAIFLSVTLSWDKFIVAFLLTRFDVTLPEEICSLLRSGLSTRQHAVGSLVLLVLLVPVVAVLVVEIAILRIRAA